MLAAEHLTVDYGGRAAVDDISFDVLQGDLLGIVGPNGAGKTTMFRAILGLQPHRGAVRLFGHGPRSLRHLVPLVGYVPQKISFDHGFPATVSDVVSLGVSTRRTAKGARLVREAGLEWGRTYGGLGGARERTAAALSTVGLGALAGRRIGELSGGELQRVIIAKSLVNDPLLLILDEPVTGVDAESQAAFYDVMNRINESGTTIIWSSHDLTAIERHAEKVACMDGSLFFHGGKEQFFKDEEALGKYRESAMQMHMHGHDG
ncbi:ABC-type Mn2 /Zn2 transport system, ATPase component [Cenarchaeum symbiosum A]|uniref:ABC-type Mn2 /Zn2 transport system, ATPase component n=1 Tax=Cenarchaeum symbiosum (strain A) TaxID=414004 RepID=A0RWG8_CENSY|nr:ABC-type Mn2 /Zn2 transport system, ATPase component [Cenarchaeum symbiosum A]